MKISLVVASGVHQGKAIPVPGAKFLIGRDPQCQLRPASQAISKQHCAVLVRDGKVFVQDFGSTNGTFVNDEQLEANTEREIAAGERLRVGPLDFTIQFTAGSDSTPLPEALKSVGGSKTEGLKAAAGVKPTSSTAAKPAPKLQPQPIPKATSEDPDAAAAMLLGMDDDDPTGAPPVVPEGSTVFELPAGGVATPKPDEKKDPKKVISREDSSNAASEILRKYMRRPR